MNNYHIQEEVGRGKFSVVYKGRKKKSIEYVAIKSVERGRRKKLMDEVAIFTQIQNDHISQLSDMGNPGEDQIYALKNWHPNILRFYNQYETRNHFWIILEYCSGGDLFQLMEQDKKLPEETVKKFAYELLEGLSYLHSQGIIFGDLKPSNILVNEYCKLKLSDFGLAKKITDLSNMGIKSSSAEDRASSHSQANSSSKNKAGTPYYMAPELFEDNGVYSYFSDFWSLGCILIEMATGKPPFYTNSLQDLIKQIVVQEVPVIPKFSEEFNDLIQKMLQKDPVNRINWEEIKRHPWWQTPIQATPGANAESGGNNRFFEKIKEQKYAFTRRIYQPQVQFDKYLQNARGIDPNVYHQARNRHITMAQPEPAAQIDVMRISYNVMRNMQQLEEPKPVAAKPGRADDDFNQYNSNVQNRNSKLHKNNSIDDLEEEEIATAQNPKNDIDQIDFYSKKKSLGGSNQKDPYDYNLGKNKKLVVDFSLNTGQEEEKQPILVKKSSSPNPMGSKTNPNVIQKNNFFDNKINRQKSPPKQSPVPGRPVNDNLRPQDSKKALFQDRKVSPMVQKPKTDSQKTSMIQNIDRFQFLNDQFDQFDDFEENKSDPISQDMGIRQGSVQEYVDKPVKSFPKWDFHQPRDAEQAFQTLRMLKDSTLFNSPLSQAQIKSEIQTLVTQTVQIGPVQNQSSANGIGSGGSGMSSYSNNSSHSLGRIGGELSSMSNNSRGVKSFNEEVGVGLHNQPTQMKVPHKSIEQLIIHNSDTAVKPIVGNKEIERIQESTYNVQHLKFVPWTSDEVIAKINTTQIESHLSDVYTSIASNTTINEKISTLQYFESIIVNSNVSNSLINSVFMALLKKMLEQIKSPMIKIRVCSVVGLLIRHSTIIDNELAEIDIASQLIDTLRDSNEKVRRRAIAALGEYMFYAATQLDDEMADPVWELSDDAIDIIVHSLDEQEPDQIVRFYACKTLENICAQSTSAGHRFANHKTVQRVLGIFMMEMNEPEIEQQEADQQSYVQWYEGIRISAAIALSHMCKLNPQLFPVIFQTITPTRFCETLMHGNGQSRVQQAFITMLNLALHNIYYPQISSILLQERLFLKALMRLLEHQHIVIRGKCILTFLLLIKLDFRWMTAIQQEIKFFNELDKILRDNYKYVQCCLLCLAEGIQEIVPTILKNIGNELQIKIEKAKNQVEQEVTESNDQNQPSNLDFLVNKSGTNEYGDFSDIVSSQLYLVTILLDLNINPLIRSRLLSTPMIQSLAAMLDVCDVNSFKGANQYLNALLIMAENLSSNFKVLTILAQPILSLLVPVLIDKLTNSKSEDIKFMSFKIYTDIMTQYIGEETIYNPKVKSQNTEIIETAIREQILPKIYYVLKECQDPIPMFGLKLLNVIVERNPSHISKLKKLCAESSDPNPILVTIASFYQVNHPRLNKYTLSLMKTLIEAKEFGIQDLQNLNILQNTHGLVSSMTKNRQEWSLEIMMDILHDLLTHFNDLVKSQQEDQIIFHIDQIFNNFESCVMLLNLQFDTSLVEKASQCLIQMLQLYAQSKQRLRDIYFVEHHFDYLINSIMCERQIIQKRVLKCIYWALIQNEYQINLPADKIFQLEEQIEPMLNSEDRSISHTSREVYRLLNQQKTQSTSGASY